MTDTNTEPMRAGELPAGATDNPTAPTVGEVWEVASKSLIKLREMADHAEINIISGKFSGRKHWAAVAVCGDDTTYAGGVSSRDRANLIVEAVNQHATLIEQRRALLAQRDELLAALRVTAGNIRSLGPAGALNDAYRPWLAVVEDAIAFAEPK